MNLIGSMLGNKNNNSYQHSLLNRKSLMNLKLKSVNLDSLNINRDDIEMFTNSFKTKPSGFRRNNIFKIPRNKIGLRDDEFISKVIVPTLVKHKKRQADNEKCLVSRSILSITSKQSFNKGNKAFERVKSHKSLIKSSTSSKTTIKMQIHSCSQINRPTPTYNSILMESIPPSFFDKAIECPVFVPYNCILKRKTELENKVLSKLHDTDKQNAPRDPKIKANNVIPTLMQKIESMEDQISNISNTTKQIKEAVSQQNVFPEDYCEDKKQNDFNISKTTSQKLLLNTEKRKNRRVKVKSLKPHRKGLISAVSNVNTSRECYRNYNNFVFEPNGHISSFQNKNEAVKHFASQANAHQDTIADDRSKSPKEINSPTESVLITYPNVASDTIFKTSKHLSGVNNYLNPKQEMVFGRGLDKFNKEGEKHKPEVGPETTSYYKHCVSPTTSGIYVTHNPIVNVIKHVGHDEMIDRENISFFREQLQHKAPSVNDCEISDLNRKVGHLSENTVGLKKSMSLKDVLNDTISNKSVVLHDEISLKCEKCHHKIINKRQDNETKERVKRKVSKCHQNSLVAKQSRSETVIEPKIELSNMQRNIAGEKSKSCEWLPPARLTCFGQIDGAASLKGCTNSCHTIQSKNVCKWIKHACSKQTNEPEVSITIHVKDEQNYLILEGLSPTISEARTSANLINAKYKKNKCQNFNSFSIRKNTCNTQDISTTLKQLQNNTNPSKNMPTPLLKYNDDSVSAIKDIQQRDVDYDKQFCLTENFRLGFKSPVGLDMKSREINDLKNIEFETGKKKEICQSIEKYDHDYLDRKRREQFDEHLRSATPVADADKITFENSLADNNLYNSLFHNSCSDVTGNEYSCLTQLVDSNYVNTSGEVLMGSPEDNISEATSELQQTFPGFTKVLKSSPRDQRDIDRLALKGAPPFGYVHDPNIEETNKKISVDLKRRSRRCGLTLLKDLVEEPEEEIKKTNVEHDMGDNLETRAMCDDTQDLFSKANEGLESDYKETRQTFVIPVVETCKSSVSVQTDWSLVGMTEAHLYISTTTQLSVGCQTGNITDTKQDNLLSGSSLHQFNSINASQFSEPIAHEETTKMADKNNYTEINFSEIFVKDVEHHSEEEENVADPRTEDLDNSGKIQLRLSVKNSCTEVVCHDEKYDKYEMNSSHVNANNTKEIRHNCYHPCFPSISEESIKSDLDISCSEACILPNTYDFLSPISEIDSGFMGIGNTKNNPTQPPCISTSIVDMSNIMTKNSSFRLGTSGSSKVMPIISNVKSSPQTNLSDYVDLNDLKSYCLSNSENNIRTLNLRHSADSGHRILPRDKIMMKSKNGEVPIIYPYNTVEINNYLTKSHNNYVVNYLYTIEYDMKEKYAILR